MSSSDSVSMATKVESQPACHFMRLPIEVREMIYRPLVIAKYVMMEQTMNSEEFNNDRRRILYGPDQEYRFETAILATNRRIHEEVRDLCQRENHFIRLTSRQPSSLGFHLERNGLQMIAKCSRARNFWNTSMTLTLDPPDLCDWPRARPFYSEHVEDPPKDGRPWTYIFCSDELPKFCRFLLYMYQYDVGPLKESILDIDTSSAITDRQVNVIDDHPAGRARMERFLGPLRQLHSLGAAQIDGPISGRYKGEIIERICRHCPVAMDIVHETVASLEQADEQASRSQLRRANLGYKATLSLLRSCYWHHEERDFIMSDGPFPGLEVHKVVDNIEVRIHARIASVYYKMNQLRMARIYIVRALEIRRPFQRRIRVWQELSIHPWEHIVYAELLHVDAMVSYAYRDVYAAVNTLSQAGEYAPLDEAQTARLEAWQAHAAKLEAIYYKKSEARTRELEIRSEKIDAIMEVVFNWKRRGEGLFRSGRTYLAASVYQKALKKLELLRDKHESDFWFASKIYQGHWMNDVIRRHAFKLETCLAAANLKSRNYTEVVARTYSPLNCEDESHSLTYRDHDYCSHSYGNNLEDWEYDLRNDYIRIHYCRAMALYHLGDTVAATEHMEAALGLDPGDNHVFEKLTMLKQKLAEEAVPRKLRLTKLNKPQTQLRKKQERRRMKG